MVIRYRPPKVRVKSKLLGVLFMAKYSEAFKLQVVQEYLDGPLGYSALAKKHAIPDAATVRKWVTFFQEFGLEGLKRKRKKTVYPVQFKVDVLHFMKETGASYSETAIAFGMNNPSLIANWNRAFQENGIKGLKPKQKGRPPMSRKPRKQPGKQAKSTSLSQEELERENELLRLEIAYLKKLKAFRENPDTFLEKHKQQWHTHSKKKDSN